MQMFRLNKQLSGQGPTVLAVGAGVGCLDILFSLVRYFSLFSHSLPRYRLKYCLTGSLNPKLPFNQSISYNQ